MIGWIAHRALENINLGELSIQKLDVVQVYIFA
jgi:hypothetical protein